MGAWVTGPTGKPYFDPTAPSGSGPTHSSNGVKTRNGTGSGAQGVGSNEGKGTQSTAPVYPSSGGGGGGGGGGVVSGMPGQTSTGGGSSGRWDPSSGLMASYSTTPYGPKNYGWGGPTKGQELGFRGQTLAAGQAAQVKAAQLGGAGLNDFNSAYAGQGGLAAQLLAESQGGGPDPAALQMHQAQQQNLASQLAMARSSAGGPAAGGGMYNAAQNAAAGNANIAGQGMVAENQQQLAAQGQLGGLLQGMAGQGLQEATTNASLAAAQKQANQNIGLGYANTGLGYNQGAIAVGQGGLQGQIAAGQNQLGAQSVNAQESEANAQAAAQLDAAIATGGSSLLGAVLSDINAKTNIQPGGGNAGGPITGGNALGPNSSMQNTYSAAQGKLKQAATQGGPPPQSPDVAGPVMPSSTMSPGSAGQWMPMPPAPTGQTQLPQHNFQYGPTQGAAPPPGSGAGTPSSFGPPPAGGMMAAPQPPPGIPLVQRHAPPPQGAMNVSPALSSALAQNQLQRTNTTGFQPGPDMITSDPLTKMDISPAGGNTNTLQQLDAQVSQGSGLGPSGIATPSDLRIQMPQPQQSHPGLLTQLATGQLGSQGTGLVSHLLAPAASTAGAPVNAAANFAPAATANPGWSTGANMAIAEAPGSAATNAAGGMGGAAGGGLANTGAVPAATAATEAGGTAGADVGAEAGLAAAVGTPAADAAAAAGTAGLAGAGADLAAAGGAAAGGLGAAAAAGGTVAGDVGVDLGVDALSFLSDARAKKMIRPGAGKSITDLLLNTFANSEASYRYKDPRQEPTNRPTGGKYLGVMAQAVEQVPEIGKQLVKDGPRGKTLEGQALLSALAAGEGRLNERLTALEESVSRVISLTEPSLGQREAFRFGSSGAAHAGALGKKMADGKAGKQAFRFGKQLGSSFGEELAKVAGNSKKMRKAKEVDAGAASEGAY
jgi:hypothetical protein